MRKSRTKTGNESRLITSSYRESNSQQTHLGYQPMVYSWETELHSVICNWEHTSINCLSTPTPPVGVQGMVRQGLEIASEMHGMTRHFTLKPSTSWWHPWAKIVVIFHPFLPKSWFMSGILQLFLKGRDWYSCCYRTTEFNGFPSFRPTFFNWMSKPADALSLFCLEIPSH